MHKFKLIVVVIVLSIALFIMSAVIYALFWFSITKDNGEFTRQDLEKIVYAQENSKAQTLLKYYPDAEIEFFNADRNVIKFTVSEKKSTSLRDLYLIVPATAAKEKIMTNNDIYLYCYSLEENSITGQIIFQVNDSKEIEQKLLSNACFD